MISTFMWTSASRGGRHGEAPASHDEKKTSGEEGESEAITYEANEGQEVGPQFEETASFEGRQNLPSGKSADESTQTEGGFGMTAEPANLPKTGGQVAKVLGSLTNDPRITNLLMLVIIAVGMGVHESIQTHVCSL